MNGKYYHIDYLSIFIFSERYCMSQKIEKPILSGQRIKTRKRGK